MNREGVERYEEAGIQIELKGKDEEGMGTGGGIRKQEYRQS